MNKATFTQFFLYIVVFLLMLPSLSFFFNIQNFSLQEFKEVIHGLQRPLLNTILLSILVSFFSLIIGSSLFWLVNFHQFYGVRIFRYLIFLPILIPIYIVGYADAHFFEYSPLAIWIYKFLNIKYIHFKSYVGATFVMSLTLYPYIYLLMQAIFKKIQNVILVSRIHGYNSIQIYFQVLFSSARPIIIFALSIISMEVISEYGLSSSYGLNNLSNFLYKKWFYAHQYNYTSIAAILVFLLIALILILEEKNRQNTNYAANMHSGSIGKFYLKGWQSYLATSYCLLIIGLAFILPIGELVYLASKKYELFFHSELYKLLINSIMIASIISICAVIMGYLINFIFNQNQNFPSLKNILKILITFSYGVPGSFIAISLIIYCNKVTNLSAYFNPQIEAFLRWLIFGTIFGIIYGCLFRFVNIAIYTINSNLISQKKEINWCKQIYGFHNKIYCFFWCLPLITRAILSVFLIVFIDSIKELPITLILRPFNFSNLTIKTYELIGDELYEEAAIPALIIIAICALISLLLFYLMNREEKNVKLY